MNSNFSLTTGCFVHKRNLKKKKSGTTIQSPHIKQFEKLWQNTEQKIKAIEENAYRETFDGLLQFVKESHLNKVIDVNEIPAAILVMGVNMPDHSNIFYLLEQQMHASGIPATIVLQSKDCGTHSNLMQKLVTTVIERYQNEMGLEQIALRKLDYTFSKLLSYYNDLLSAECKMSPRKSKKKKAGAKDFKLQPIVIFVQDVEAFNVGVLQEFILSCSLYIEKLPVVLVFGMASAMVTLHNILPQKVLCCLGIETFYSMTAIEYLTKIIQEVVLDSGNPFKLGPKVFRLIVDTVLYHDFSVTNLTSLLKFCMLEHFYNNPLAAVSCNASEITEQLQQLHKDDLSLFRKLPSFTRFVENNPECKTTMKNEKEFKILIRNLLMKHHSYHQLLMALLNLLHIWVKDLPGSPFGKHFREIYPLALEDTITSVSGYSQAENLLKALSRQELELRLCSCLEFLKDTEMLLSDPCLSEVKELLKTELEKLRNVEDSANLSYEEIPYIDDEFEKITSRSQLQEKLKLRLKAKRSKFDNCRDNIVQTLTEIFKKLHPPSELPLYEVLYFDNAIAIKRHLMAVPRATIHRNLMNPQMILKCQCCGISESKQISSLMPDICSLYKLHLECGKLINLCDCLEAFKSLKENELKKNSELDLQLNVRFMHAISELQLLGFVKPTKRKTDHMAKLTFGSF